MIHQTRAGEAHPKSFHLQWRNLGPGVASGYAAAGRRANGLGGIAPNCCCYRSRRQQQRVKNWGSSKHKLLSTELAPHFFAHSVDTYREHLLTRRTFRLNHSSSSYPITGIFVLNCSFLHTFSSLIKLR